ncbi:MAG TPA: hypothetical protein VF503_14145 [Sphingobium sp.]|uniref:hypothetical protein n=1 Tax=Sphingobium sp. TaxID=1912891 RepID=UPI002ED3CEEB
MKGRAPERPNAGSPFSWSGAMWSVVMAAITYGLYALQEYRILSEEQIILLIFIALPTAAFFLSGSGQDRSESGGDGVKD